MKYIDINQKFTAKVAEYIAKGYTINTATMSGSQGEVAHVDLTDGKQVVRVLLDSLVSSLRNGQVRSTLSIAAPAGNRCSFSWCFLA